MGTEPKPHKSHATPTHTHSHSSSASASTSSSTLFSKLSHVFISQIYYPHIATLLLLGELIFGILIIQYVPYTEIDWKAYMKQVETFTLGEYNYMNIRGGTGPLVYPAGFLYLFTALYNATDNGLNVVAAQYIYLGLYLCVLALTFVIYHRTKAVPPFVLIFLCLSKRIHSIFMLRLFNDCWAMFFLYTSIYFMLRNRWTLACIILSVAISIKMNVLLFLPALGLLLLERMPLFSAIGNVLIIFIVQLILGAPFLATFPVEYFNRAFEFKRQFFYIWTVNWKMLPEEIFLSKSLSLGLLICHLSILFLFLNRISPFGLLGHVKNVFAQLFGKKPSFALIKKDSLTSQDAHHIVTTLLGSNFIGICFARSLHYQFYVWFFHSLPFLLFQSNLSLALKVCLFFAMEVCWNVFPATAASSSLLLFCHMVLLLCMFTSNKLYTSVPSANIDIERKVK